MTNKKIWLGVLALALIFGMTVVGCGGDDGGGGGPQTAKYEGEDAAGNTYTLTITEKARAVYAGTEGDSYTLTIKMKDGTVKTSKGTVETISTDGTFTLQPSVAGSDTFSVVINGEDIKSIVGAIAIEGGTPITAGTFDTIYLRANRWTNNVTEQYGEQWTTGPCVKISDFIDEFEIGNGKTYTVKVSGLVDTKLINPDVQFGLVRNGKWYGNLGTKGLTAIDVGNFDRTISLTAYYGRDIIQDDLDGTEEPVAQFYETINYHNPADPTWDNNNGTIPENIPDGTIMATIRNFSMIITEAQQ